MVVSTWANARTRVCPADLAELDTAGEYYIDKTGNGTLYYFPASPSDLTTGEAVISMAQNVIVLSNTPSSAALLHPSPYQAMRAAAAGPSPSEEIASVPSLRTSSIRRRRAASGGSVDAATAEQEREGLRLVRAIEAAAAAPTPGPLSNLVFNGIAAQFSRGIALGATGECATRGGFGTLPAHSAIIACAC